MKNIRRNQRVLLRIDANVPLVNGKITQTGMTRIREAIPEILRLRRRGARILLATHLGNPGGRPDIVYSTSALAEAFSDILGVHVPCLPRSIGRRIATHVKGMEPGDVAMLENLRFEPGEETNSLAFAWRLAENADVFVNNAFGVCHKKHASVSAITKCLPSFAGELVEREVVALSRRREHPFVLVLGGAKIATKIPILLKLGPQADAVIVGGGTALTFIAALGGKLPGAYAFTKPADKDEARDVIEVIGSRLVLPIDLVSSRSRRAFVDIGPKSARHAIKHIKQAKTIVWNGPMGVIEDPDARRGTAAIARAIAKHSAFSILGGGETVEFVESLGLTGAFDHVSTGGGAMLAFLGGEEMPGLVSLYDQA